MREQKTERLIESRPSWDDVGAFARQSIQTWFQRLLEEEVEDLLRRARYARREEIDAPEGYRNGLGKPRRLTLSAGTITVRRPRVRGLAERFESRVLPVFKRRTEAVGALLPTLYLHGLAEGDFDLALRGLLGEGAPLSVSSIARLKASWQAEYDEWKTRALADLERDVRQRRAGEAEPDHGPEERRRLSSSLKASRSHFMQSITSGALARSSWPDGFQIRRTSTTSTSHKRPYAWISRPLVITGAGTWLSRETAFSGSPGRRLGPKGGDLSR